MASFTVYNTRVTKDINRQQVVISISPGSRYIEQKKHTNTTKKKQSRRSLCVIPISSRILLSSTRIPMDYG